MNHVVDFLKLGFLNVTGHHPIAMRHHSKTIGHNLKTIGHPITDQGEPPVSKGSLEVQFCYRTTTDSREVAPKAVKPKIAATLAKGSHHVRKTVKKVDNVRFG